jgi:hypothetical protein
MQKQPSLSLGGHLYQKQPSVSRKKSRMPPLIDSVVPFESFRGLVS